MEEFEKLGKFLEQAKRLADMAEELAPSMVGELAAWQIHYAGKAVGHECGLSDLEVLDLMGYEDEDEPSPGSLLAATEARIRVVGWTEEEERGTPTESRPEEE